MSVEGVASGLPFVVIVVGRPASGKTTVATEIAERWNLSVVSKDVVKELLFETLGVRDRAWSRRLGRAAFALLDHIIELQLRAGAPFLIDAAYNADFENEKFQAWQHRYGFSAVQVHCRAPAEVLVSRFARRAEDGTRHPGHADERSLDEFRSSLTDARPEVLDLDGPVLEYESEREGAAQALFRSLESILPAVDPRRPE